MTKVKNELEIVKEKVVGMGKMLDKFQVTNDEELGIVSDKIKQVKNLQKYIEQEKDKFVAPAKAIIAEAKDKYDIYLKQCYNAEIVLKQRAMGYMEQKEQKRILEEAKIAAKVESGKIKTETAIKKLEALPETPKTVRTDNNSGLRMSKRKVAKIFDPTLVPKEYWIIDETRVKKEALEREKNGLPQIPGIRVEEESSMSSI